MAPGTDRPGDGAVRPDIMAQVINTNLLSLNA